MDDRNLVALIIYDFVHQEYLDKGQLSGIDELLNKLETDTLKRICSDLDIRYN